MRLSKAVAISILTTLIGVQGLLIPSVGEIIDVFGKNAHDKLEPLKEAAHHAAEHLGMHLQDALAPIINIDATKDIIPHKYIIVFKEGVTPQEIAFHQEWVASTHLTSLNGLEEQDPFFAATKEIKPEGGITDVFDISSLFSGYTGYFMDSTIEMIRKNPLVAFIEKDSIVQANEFAIEKGSPWGLARVSHRQPLSLSSFDQYLYDSEGGSGVTAYVIDTGINVNHAAFDGRAKWGATIPSGDSDIDGNGHGTHCAGTIGSTPYGVAKNVQLRAIKVLRSNGSGTMSDVVKGVEKAVQLHQAESKKKGHKGSVANMSLGGGKSPALDLAVNAAVKNGVHFAVAAGNENQDACNTSPASAEGPITVGASTISDERAYFSNYGKCVDIFAPGLNILSTYIGSDTATAYLSGTSMASPHVAGLLSYYLSLQPGSDSEYFTESIDPKSLKKKLIDFGTKDILTDIPADTPNILAFNGAGHNLTDFWA
ncbi:PRB1 Cerevisin [Candida maltosa Xu316]|uniref:Cerevisin n=1 Tax=Candida maltosa (strain Xu316) TaxID=1245528 RepID=M3JXG2_CANMX|nr:Cerevisin [Candida maltosa Xu316]